MYNHEKYKDGISYYTDVISAPHKLVEFIAELDEYEKAYPSISKWDQDVKHFYKPLQTEDPSIDRKSLYIYNSIFSAMWFCTRLYAESRKIDFPESKLDKTFSLTRQSQNPVDLYSSKANDVAFNVVVYLNDDYEGGEIHFPNQEFMVKPEAGSLIIFPANTPYEYELKDITSGVKYEVPGFWFK